MSQERACPKSGLVPRVLKGLSQERACPKNAKQYSFSKHSFSSQLTQMQRFDLIPLIVQHVHVLVELPCHAASTYTRPQNSHFYLQLYVERHLQLYKRQAFLPRAARKRSSICSASSPQGQPTNASPNSAAQAAKSALRLSQNRRRSQDIRRSSQNRQYFLSWPSTKGISSGLASITSTRSMKATLQG